MTSWSATRARRLLGVLALCFWTGAPADAQSRSSGTQPDIAAFDRYVTQGVRDWRAAGLAIAVVHGDSVVLAKGYGVLDIAKPDRVTEHTRFAIGSTTKAMTSVALGMLVDEGKLRFDDRVIDLLPDFRLYDPYVTREITVRDLLTHRSGLASTDLMWLRADLAPDEMIRRLRHVRPASSFRAQWDYQNNVYAIAGAIVAKVSGRPWEDFVRTRIFQPLGMTDSEPLVSLIVDAPNVATPHAIIRDTVRQVAIRTTDPVASAGSVYSSVSDMAKWLRFVLDSGRVGGKRLLTPATFSEIVAPQIRVPQGLYPALRLARPHGFSYALGWFVQDYQGAVVWMHTGSINGMSAIVGLLPDRRVGVVVLANLDHVELRHALMYRVFDMYAGNAERDWSSDLRAMFARTQGAAGARPATPEGRPSLPIERYAGTYVDSTYGDVVVTHANGVLRARFGRQELGALEPSGYEAFRSHGPPPQEQRTVLAFTRDAAGNVGSVRVFGVNFMRTAR
jgi:CubicO group peptidase (beta-lactamase class C family)